MARKTASGWKGMEERAIGSAGMVTVARALGVWVWSIDIIERTEGRTTTFGQALLGGVVCADSPATVEDATAYIAICLASKIAEAAPLGELACRHFDLNAQENESALGLLGMAGVPRYRMPDLCDLASHRARRILRAQSGFAEVVAATLLERTSIDHEDINDDMGKHWSLWDRDMLDLAPILCGRFRQAEPTPAVPSASRQEGSLSHQ